MYKFFFSDVSVIIVDVYHFIMCVMCCRTMYMLRVGIYSCHTNMNFFVLKVEEVLSVLSKKYQCDFWCWQKAWIFSFSFCFWLLHECTFVWELRSLIFFFIFNELLRGLKALISPTDSHTESFKYMLMLYSNLSVFLQWGCLTWINYLS